MPDSGNSVAVASPDASAPLVVQPRLLAVGVKLAKVQQIVLLEADEQAPHFQQGQEPLADGTAYRAADGHLYYRPDLVVARSATAGPNVRFLKDPHGKVRLEFELDEQAPAGVVDEALPFNVRVTQVVLNWTEGGQAKSRAFADPTLTVAEEGAAGPLFTVRVGADLAPAEVAPLALALKTMEARAAVSVGLSYGYWVDEARPAQPPRPPRAVRTIPPAVLRRVSAVPPASATQPASTAQPAAATPAEVSLVASPVALKPMRAVIDAAVMGDVLEKAKRREQQPNFKRADLGRAVPFTFLESLPEHRRIYAALEGRGVLAATWESSETGWIRGAPFANTVYRVPDEIRLAYNAELGVPHFLPVLYREGQDERGDVRVRVVLRAEPWHDPEKLVRLRDDLHARDPGLYAAPVVVAGGWEQATLKLTGAFPEQLRLVDGNDRPVSLERGFEIRLDLTLEFYRFLCQTMTNAPGLTGEVHVVLDSTPEPGAPAGTPPRTRSDYVPVRLTLDDLASLPVEIAVPEDAIKPQEVTIRNRAAAEMRVRGCVPRLVQLDENSAVPLDVYEAAPGIAFPASVPAGGSLAVPVKPKDARPDQLWNAVHVQLTGPELVTQADQVLNRIYEVTPTATMAWKIAVECPVFLQDPLPDRFKNLYRVEVKITREGFAAQQVVLRKGQAAGQVTMQRSLREIMGADALPAFAYRVRNIYVDHEGRWSDEKRGEGSDIVVFPNPVEGD